MNISSLSALTGSGSDTTSIFQKRKEAMEGLATALKSGDLTAAKTAFSKLQALSPNQSQSGAASTTSSTSSTNPMQQDMNAISTALSSGDLSSAQSAFATFQSHLQSGPPNGGNGGPNGGGAGQDQMASDFQALTTALNSGDLSGAQSAFATIQKHMGQAQGTTSSDGTSSTSSSSGTKISDAVNALSKALSTGDLSGAQTAETSLFALLKANAPSQTASITGSGAQIDISA